MKKARLATLIAAGALAATLVPAAGAQACGGSPRGAAVRYYHAIDAKRFNAAWRCLSSATRKRLGGYARWKSGFRGLAWTHIANLRLVDQAAGTAELNIGVRSCRRVAGEKSLVERFGGRWGALNGFAGWRLHNPRIRRLGSTNASGC